MTMLMTRGAWLAVCMCLVSCWTSIARGEYGPKDAVVVLTDKNFEKEVLNSPDFWLVEFYAPWCGHCQKLEPEYKAAAKKLKSHARLGAVDATVHQSLAQKYKIKGYPTIKEFGANKKKPRDYQGGRTRKEIIQYVKNSDEAQKLGVSGATVDTVDFQSIQTFLTKDDTTPTAIFFGSKKVATKKKKVNATPPSWLGSLAQQFVKGKKKKKATVEIAFVPGTDDKIAKHFGIADDQLPAVLVVDALSKHYLVADVKNLNENTAKSFITSAIGTPADKRTSWSVLPSFPTPEVAKKKPTFKLEELTAPSITNCLAQSGKMCVILTKSDGSDSEAKFKSLAKRYRRDPFRFFWTDKSSAVFQTITTFLETPGIDALVMKPGRLIKFTKHAGSNEEKALTAFLDKVVEGSALLRVCERATTDLEALLKHDQQEQTNHEEL